MRRRIPEATIRRLTHYLRCIEFIKETGAKILQSRDLATFCSISDSLVRRDLSYFGEFGTKGVGYSINDLEKHLKKILGINKIKKVGLAGVGNIGSALLNFPLMKNGFHIVAAFDVKDELIGKEINGVKIYHENDMIKVFREKNLEIGIIAVPQHVALDVANKMIEGGTRGILSFALLQCPLSKKIPLRYIEIAAELEILSYEIEKEG